MALTTNLGFLMSFQKIFTIPNLDGNIFVTILRMVPTLILTILAINDIIYIVSIRNISPLYDISGLADLVARMELMSNRSAFVLIVLQAIRLNSRHLKLISDLIKFEQTLEETCIIQRTTLAILRSNVEIIISVGFSLFLYGFFWYSDNPKFSVKSLLTYIIHVTILIANDLLLLYVVHIIKAVSNFANTLTCVKSCDESVFKLVVKFLELPLKISSATGGMVFVSFMQHMGCSALVSYYIFWISFGSRWFNEKIFFLCGCSLWFIRNIYYVIYLAITGNTMTHMVHKVIRFQNNMEDDFDDQNRTLLVQFNQEQIQLWLSHLKSNCVVAGSIEITKAGFFLILSFTVTSLIILLQFKQLEDSSRKH